ncbi:hypothetical protein [Piscinibacter koreensis]|uniref:Uncharacterized protein n=1 Tax=Piscinibacter koreensis TaxID=2742824 RepID=A0A7Y6TYW2_9BURK|nr:hypothetical protein [Schlegelella koreensis]NUZ08481.1 hypothetical protein [Schlegelella koreensis]
MRRSIASLLVMVLLPWQALTWAATSLADETGAEGRHAMAHWSAAAHHHDDAHDQESDGFHQDDSDESIQHAVQSDAYLSAVAVLPAAIQLGAAVRMSAAQPAFRGHPCSSPFLEGPRRPPRSC